MARALTLAPNPAVGDLAGSHSQRPYRPGRRDRTVSVGNLIEQNMTPERRAYIESFAARPVVHRPLAPLPRFRPFARSSLSRPNTGARRQRRVGTRGSLARSTDDPHEYDLTAGMAA